MKKYRTVAIALMTSTVLSGCNPLGSIDDMATNVGSEYLGQFQITEIEGKAIEANSKPQMSLNEDGSLTGNSGCNSFSGSYEWLGSVLRIGDMASTKNVRSRINGSRAEITGVIRVGEKCKNGRA